MRSKARIIIISNVFIIFLIFPLSVKGATKSNYISYKQGIYSVESDDLEHSDTKFYGELVFGHYFIPYFSLEAGIGYLDTEGTLRQSVSTIDSSIVGRVETSAVPLTIAAKGIYPFRFFPIKKGELFVAVGAGFYFVHTKANLSSSIGDVFSLDDNDTTYGIQAELGANIDITRVVFFGIAGKYIKAKEAEFTGTAIGAPLRFEVDLSRITITANIGIRF